jgi:hypothetical protein
MLARLWHSKPLFAPKALHFLVIECPAFCTGVVRRAPKWRSEDRNVAARNSFQFRISQKPLERGVFTLELFKPLDFSPRPD